MLGHLSKLLFKMPACIKEHFELYRITTIILYVKYEHHIQSILFYYGEQIE